MPRIRSFPTAACVAATALVLAAPASSSAQPVIDVGACARYDHAARAKQLRLDALESATPDDGSARQAAELRDDIDVLGSALRLCSDYFHLHANYTALKRSCAEEPR